ncbi:hypothetical protein [Sabulicella glaciei]|uniref:Phage baseplate protein n=1 Tax=Sabulicella glaciei TaxID=2984948 RepID=A0ABT3NQ41_9PROT|nr:hypothetical protein [Roseococcus sp. MDT2-1-1]MCW8084282.1 hypothetical protein [Roseococcus sp. MDT2-1-1]
MGAAPIAAASLLDAWEQGARQHPLHRALKLLQVAEPHTSLEALAELPIGERDRRLFALRARLFGPRLEAVIACPQCGEQMDIACDGRAVFGAEARACEAELEIAGRRVCLRAPTTADLLEIAQLPPDERPAALLAQCADEAADAHEVESRLAELDPLAEVSFALGCAACGHAWAEVFDIAGFLWTEVGERAQRLLRDIHTLARAYGWREGDILALSPQRRAAYLSLVAEG